MLSSEIKQYMRIINPLTSRKGRAKINIPQCRLYCCNYIALKLYRESANKEKVQIKKKCKGHNEAGWEIGSAPLAYERTTQYSDNSKEDFN